MSGSGKRVIGSGKANKTVPNTTVSFDTMRPVWFFDKLDKSGLFAFDTTRPDFQHKDFLDKMIAYCNMTWIAIKSQTHDSGKSKHHTLDEQGFSKEAKERIRAKGFEQETDRIFSFAFDNKLRVIGLKENEAFHVVWYDSQHQFYPSNKK